MIENSSHNSTQSLSRPSQHVSDVSEEERSNLTAITSTSEFNSAFFQFPQRSQWLEELSSTLSGKRLSGCLYQFYLEDLSFVDAPVGRTAKRCYEQVHQALSMVSNFAKLHTIPQYPRDGTVTEKTAWSATMKSTMKSFASGIEQLVVQSVNAARKEAKKAACIEGQRDRKVGCTVSALVKAWGEIPQRYKDQVVCDKLSFSQFVS